MIQAIALGELLIDFACINNNASGYPVMSANPGGAPANWLAAIQKFGKQTALIAKVGDDSFGKLLCKTLEERGINTEGLIIAPDVFTTLAFVTFDENNDRQFAFARKPGADTRLTKEEIKKDLIDQARVFHFGTLSLTDEPAISATRFAVDYAKKNNKLISFDPNLRKPLWNDLSRAKEEMLWGISQADVVKISDEEVDFLWGKINYEEAADLMIKEYGVKLVYITQGSKGCLFANAQAKGSCPAFCDGEVKDTTGAGDIFGGSAMWKLLEIGKDPQNLSFEEMDSIVKFASISAGLSIQQPGGISSVPELEDVLSRI